MSIIEIRDPNTGVLRWSLDPTTGVVTETLTGDDTKIRGLTVPAPVAGDDGKALCYDHDTLSLVWTALS